jgi:hypothetical protein
MGRSQHSACRWRNILMRKVWPYLII